jgi:hypothetical protein
MPKRSLLLLLIVVLSLSLPVQAFAASTARLSNTAKTSVEKLGAQAGSPLQGKLNDQIKQIQSLETQDLSVEKEISSLNSANDELLLAINTRIKKLDADKLDKLKKQAAEAKERYKPLFELQTSLNKQYTYAKKLKNKTLTAALEAQLNVVKASALVAKEDIRAKQEAYSKALETKSKTVKQVRNILSEASLEQVRIRSEKKASVETGKQIAADSKGLTAAIKNKAPAEALTRLTSMAALSNQMIGQKNRMLTSEKKVSSILAKASALLPAG